MKQSAGLSRRQFIRITASAGLLLAGGVGYGLAGSQTGAVRVEETQLLLGSIANLTLISTRPEQARRAIVAAFQHMSSLEDVFSRFRPQSQLSRLNARGSLNNPDPALVTVLTQAVHYGDLTGGAFDVTVEPVLNLYRVASQTGQLPSAEAVAAARQWVDYHRISITDSMIRLHNPKMRITLDGIAKGYIIDSGAAVLKAHGFDQIMVELGGDLQTGGHAGARPWQIGIEQPVQPMAVNGPLIAQLHDAAMATSGDYQYAFTPDRRLHHILDPLSGVSPGELASASVIAPTASDADALSTALLVMGAQAGLNLIESLPAVEALVITKQGAMQNSARFPLAGRAPKTGETAVT